MAIVSISNPPLNLASHCVRTGLIRAVTMIANDAAIDSAVLIGSGATFISGSDLREFGDRIEEPLLPQVVSAIEASDRPWIAAIHGSALGGGLEIALACDVRLAAAANTVLGLPEVTLGMIPGAGGTQRLPRLVGVAKALDLVCSGRRVTSDEALKLGIVDQVVEGDLLDAAITVAEAWSQGKRRVSDGRVPAHSAREVEQAARTAMSRGHDQPQIRAAVEAVTSAALIPFEDGLVAERLAFEGLQRSPEAAALRHLFFAERLTVKDARNLQHLVRPLRTAAVVGAGTMGPGIAVALTLAGLDVTLIDVSEGALRAGHERAVGAYRRSIGNRRFDGREGDHDVRRISCSTELQAAEAADVIIETVTESLSSKREVFSALDKIAKPGAILASNTSYLDINELARATRRPSDVLGVHFFAPAHRMRLLEIVRGTDTSESALASSLELALRMGKVGIVAKNCDGFIANRIMAAYRHACECLLQEGAYPEDVDRALTGFGFKMGPFAVADLSGLDIAWHRRLSLGRNRSPGGQYLHTADRLCEMGRLGRKTGAGWYRYEAGLPRPLPDPLVRDLLDEESRATGMLRRKIPDREIVNRALTAMVQEAVSVLAAGIAARASDIDLAMVRGMGFPAHKGGPLYWAGHGGQPTARGA